MSKTSTTTADTTTTTTAEDWQHDERGTWRVIFGTSRLIPGRSDVCVQASAIEMVDGSIDPGRVEPPGVHLSIGADPLTVGQARAVASAITLAADEFGTETSAIRTAIAGTDPADLTAGDRAALLDFLQRALDAAGIE
jgi:hypothetical protein